MLIILLIILVKVAEDKIVQEKFTSGSSSLISIFCAMLICPLSKVSISGQFGNS